MFISFEGIDGCGKTTQLQMLAGYLRGLGRDVVATREPGGTRLAEEVRSMLLSVRASGDAPTARAVCALLSDFFPATTGEIVHVDGGFHAMGM